MKGVPKITENFILDLEKKAKKGNYIVEVNGMEIVVFPYVFPPLSPFSESSRPISKHYGNLRGKQVLDIGTGTGVQAIMAALKGARVDAIDLFQPSVECAQKNVEKLHLNDQVKVWLSDLFSFVPKKKYDLIIANLPIIDSSEIDVKFYSLFDPNFNFHKRLFAGAREYLTKEGKIILCHADLEGEEGFLKLEKLAEEKGFRFEINDSVNALGHEWRIYSFFGKNDL